ncbi:hypothetical protein ACROYT_G022516 [Oculina patagonica]
MLEGYPKRQPETIRFPHFMPEKDMQDILAPEDHKQGTLSKDRTTGHHHDSQYFHSLNNVNYQTVTLEKITLRTNLRQKLRESDVAIYLQVELYNHVNVDHTCGSEDSQYWRLDGSDVDIGSVKNGC